MRRLIKKVNKPTDLQILKKENTFVLATKRKFLDDRVQSK